MKEEIGFIHGVPENPEKTWEKSINGRRFTFLKKRVGQVFFLYNCKCSSERTGITLASSTGFHSDRNLTPEEVEHLPQFTDFIVAHN